MVMIGGILITYVIWVIFYLKSISQIKKAFEPILDRRVDKLANQCAGINHNVLRGSGWIFKAGTKGAFVTAVYQGGAMPQGQGAVAYVQGGIQPNASYGGVMAKPGNQGYDGGDNYYGISADISA